MSLDVAMDVRAHMLAAPTHKIRLETGLGGYRIIAHDGRVIATGSDVSFARQLVDDHNKDVEKTNMTGTRLL